LIDTLQNAIQYAKGDFSLHQFANSPIPSNELSKRALAHELLNMTAPHGKKVSVCSPRFQQVIKPSGVKKRQESLSPSASGQIESEQLFL